LSQDRYISIDEEGYWVFSGRRVDDEGLGSTLLENLRISENFSLETSYEGVPTFVEAFDAPLIARHIRLASEPGYAEIDLAYHLKKKLPLKSLSVDEWDRFHGHLDNGVPLVLSRQAQVEFFDLLDSFDDDSVTIQGVEYATPSWLSPNADTFKDAWWTNLYRSDEAGWEMGRESVALPVILPQLKLVRAKVLVLGCGSGHDAAYMARQGHMVTAVDFSDEAIARAKDLYAGVENVEFFKYDAFKLPEVWAGRFDVIVEHTMYCAISPERRNALVKVWRKMLAPGGNLLGIFFVHEKRIGPPFGGSEWEVRERLKTGFEFLYWTRWRQSIEKRRGKELVVFARRRG
jgi:SAM-dependent methyltransferase